MTGFSSSTLSKIFFRLNETGVSFLEEMGLSTRFISGTETSVLDEISG